MKNNLVVFAIIVILAAAGAFFGGMKYQQSQRPSVEQLGQQLENGQGPRGQFPGGARQGQGFTPVNGEIISQDDSTITVKLQDGSSKIVLLGDDTSISKSSEGSKSDLKIGERVAVFGMGNSDGSVTAQSVQLNPQIREQPSSPNN